MIIKKYLSVYKGLPQNVYLICLARFVSSLIIFVYPLLTNYITLKLNKTDIEAASFVSIALLVNLACIFLGGYLSDKFSKRTLFLFSQYLLVVCSFLCALFLGSFVVVYLLVIISGIFGFTNPIYNVFILENSNDNLNTKKSGFSLLYLFLNLGVAIGPFLNGLWFEQYLALYFLLVAGLNLIATVCIQLKYKEERMTYPKQKDKKVEFSLADLWSQNHLAIKAIVFSILNFMIYIQVSFSVPLQFNIWFTNGPKIYGTMMLINASMVLLITPMILRFTKRTNPILLIIIGSFFYLVSFLCLLLFSNLAGMILFIFFLTIGEIVVQTNISVVVSMLAGKEYEGRMNSFLLLIGAFGNILGTSIVGGLIVNYSFSVVWLFIMGLSVAYAILMFLVYQKYNFEK
ncbi:hypothetical protein A5821_000278 [Enterococcus sp. 7F3_DIV0205]|uniref:Major facilitator superfamily (MFS) profile domain-containing protein n=1 Tax=Candidatus Enterococcus palustris TaxID=1834189 RepID=A0AAQ3Y4N6_9ENTE|nr:MFS transporter [Enterococcus sp. 7F3_DIV0205]OTN84691.1 hypothetical protein A5821_000620 [Enterococcus sp. 7F3_DIV0205]